MGRVARPHGIPRGGRQKFKVDLMSRGGLGLKDQVAVLVSRDPGSETSAFRELTLASAPKPLGGAWGHATGLILEVNEGELDRGDWIGVRREVLPPLPSGEFYLSDFLGKRVFDAESGLSARIVGFDDFAETLGGSPNLRLRTERREEFSVPWGCFPRLEIEAALAGADLKMEGLETWLRIDRVDPNEEKDFD